MSDHQVEPGWWRASDGKWYPPHTHPRYSALVEEARRLSAESTPPLRPPMPSRPAHASPTHEPGHPSWSTPRALRQGPRLSWFSPPAALAIATCAGGVVLAAIVPNLYFVTGLIAASAIATARAVFRYNDGHGAGYMTLAALVACVCAGVFGLYRVAVVMTAAFPGVDVPVTSGPPRSEQFDEPYIHWQEFGAGECFDFGLTHGGPAQRRRCTGPHDAEAIGATEIASDEGERATATASGDPDAYWEDRSEEACALVRAEKLASPFADELFFAAYREDPEVRPFSPDEPRTLRAKVLCIAFHVGGAKLHRSYVAGG